MASVSSLTPGGVSLHVTSTTLTQRMWNSTEVDDDPLHGRPYPSMHSWTHIGLSAFVVSTIQTVHFTREDNSPLPRRRGRRPSDSRPLTSAVVYHTCGLTRLNSFVVGRLRFDWTEEMTTSTEPSTSSEAARGNLNSTDNDTGEVWIVEVPTSRSKTGHEHAPSATGKKDRFTRTRKGQRSASDHSEVR